MPDIVTMLSQPSLKHVWNAADPASEPFSPAADRRVFARHNVMVLSVPAGPSSQSYPSILAGCKRLRETEGGDVAAVSSKSAKSLKVHSTVRFASTERTQDGPDLISHITADLIDGTIARRVFDRNTMLQSVRTSIKTSGFVIDPKLQESLKTSSGQKLVECATLLVVHKRLQLLADTIQERFSQDGGAGLVSLLPSLTRIGHAFIPVLARLQAALVSVIQALQNPALSPSSTPSSTPSSSPSSSPISSLMSPAHTELQTNSYNLQ